MKKHISVLIFSVFLNINNAFSQTSCHELKRTIESEITSQYLNKEFGSLLNNVAIQDKYSVLFIDEPTFKLDHVRLIFDKCYKVNVYFKKYKHLEQFNSKLDWDIKKAGLEKIGKIDVFIVKDGKDILLETIK